MQGVTIAPGRSSLTALAEQVRQWVVEPVLSVLFPPRCVGCGDFESYLCEQCRSTLALIGDNACPRCGEPGVVAPVHGRCARCIDKEVSYAAARGAFRHEGLARRMVADFKFGGQPVLGRIMAELAHPAFIGLLSSIPVPAHRLAVTWVASHRAAQRERGYNQAEVLARGLVRLCPPEERPAGPVALVKKTQATKHQKGLTKAGRQGNLRGAFELQPGAVARLGAEAAGIVLVDDVYTTGATAGEVSSVLAANTHLPVHVFTFSRAVVSGSERHD
jgi:predicted amidophosphoribosyltransferase